MPVDSLRLLTLALTLGAALALGGAFLMGWRLIRQARDVSHFGLFSEGLLGLLVVGVVVHGWLLTAQGVSADDLFVALMWVAWAAFTWLLLGFARSAIDRFVYMGAMERHRAKHDALTSLPNREFFSDYLKELIRTTHRADGQNLTVLVLDLNWFKSVNDKMGHAYGDILLKEIAMRLHRSLRKTDMLARLGGDEFGVIVETTEDPEQGLTVARHLISALHNPFAVHGEVADIGVSVGLARHPRDGKDPDLLLKHAKLAMMEAKRGGVDLVEYAPELDTRDPDHVHILSELREAISGNRLEVHYQPQLRLSDDRISGFEALVRWRHPRLGLLSPDEFIPLAEQSGTIEPLTYWVLERVLDELRDWPGPGRVLPISTNISPKVLLGRDLPQRVMEGLRRRGLAPSRLRLEVTESAAVADIDRARNVMAGLVAQGVSFAMDDFGTGYASLDYLKKLPVSEVKLDKSFVLSLKAQGDDAEIVRATIDLAHKLNRTVTAEGVETAEALELLRRWGCDRVQGYFVAEPGPIEQVLSELDRDPVGRLIPFDRAP